MAKIYTYIPPINTKAKDSPLTTQYDSLLTDNKTVIGAINELYRDVHGDAIAVTGKLLAGETVCGEGVESQPDAELYTTFLNEEFMDKFGGEEDGI